MCKRGDVANRSPALIAALFEAPTRYCSPRGGLMANHGVSLTMPPPNNVRA